MTNDAARSAANVCRAALFWCLLLSLADLYDRASRMLLASWWRLRLQLNGPSPM
jgi:hypothetical protein